MTEVTAGKDQQVLPPISLGGITDAGLKLPDNDPRQLPMTVSRFGTHVTIAAMGPHYGEKEKKEHGLLTGASMYNYELEDGTKVPTIEMMFEKMLTRGTRAMLLPVRPSDGSLSIIRLPETAIDYDAVTLRTRGALKMENFFTVFNVPVDQLADPTITTDLAKVHPLDIMVASHIGAAHKLGSWVVEPDTRALIEMYSDLNAKGDRTARALALKYLLLRNAAQTRKESAVDTSFASYDDLVKQAESFQPVASSSGSQQRDLPEGYKDPYTREEIESETDIGKLDRAKVVGYARRKATDDTSEIAIDEENRRLGIVSKVRRNPGNLDFKVGINPEKITPDDINWLDTLIRNRQAQGLPVPQR